MKCPAIDIQIILCDIAPVISCTIHGSDYKDSSELTVYTMEDVVFMGIKNDISFLVGEMLNLYEQQSTENFYYPGFSVHKQNNPLMFCFAP